MAYRGARSTCDGGRLKSGDVDPASPVRYCSILGSGSFIEVRRSYPKGRTGRRMASLAGLLWSWLARPLAHRSLGKRRRTRARAGSGAWGDTAWGCARGLSAEGVLWRCQGASNTWSCSSAQVLALAAVTNVRISPKVLCKISSWHLGLASSCKFQGKISPSLEDMGAPSLVCLHCSPATKRMPNRVKRPWFGFKIFRDVPWVVWPLFIIWIKWFWRQQKGEHT
jgi:hypothetical protein